MVLQLGHFGKVNWKYQESFEKWCWRRTEKITWADRARNEEVLHRVKKERNVLHTIKIKKANCIGHILRVKCLLRQCFSAAGPRPDTGSWHQLYRAARDSPGIDK